MWWKTCPYYTERYSISRRLTSKQEKGNSSNSSLCIKFNQWYQNKLDHEIIEDSAKILVNKIVAHIHTPPRVQTPLPLTISVGQCYI